MPNKLQLYKEGVNDEIDKVFIFNEYGIKDRRTGEYDTDFSIMKTFIEEKLNGLIQVIRENVPEEKKLVLRKNRQFGQLYEISPEEVYGHNSCRTQLLALLDTTHE